MLPAPNEHWLQEPPGPLAVLYYNLVDVVMDTLIKKKMIPLQLALTWSQLSISDTWFSIWKQRTETKRSPIQCGTFHRAATRRLIFPKGHCWCLLNASSDADPQSSISSTLSWSVINVTFGKQIISSTKSEKPSRASAMTRSFHQEQRATVKAQWRQHSRQSVVTVFSGLLWCHRLISTHCEMQNSTERLLLWLTL